jgi:hypothetical protein
MKITIKIGKVLSKANNPPAVNIVQQKPERIANKRCPAVMLAANRTPNEIALATCEIISITTKKGAMTIGAPLGMNIDK